MGGKGTDDALYTTKFDAFDYTNIFRVQRINRNNLYNLDLIINVATPSLGQAAG